MLNSDRLNRILALLSLSAVVVGGVFVYQLHAKQKHLEVMIPAFCSNQGQDEIKVERVVETVMRKTNPWGALQPQIKDSIVQIFSQIAEFNWLQPYQTPVQKMSAGTGFFIDEKGHFITNAHVVNQAKAVTIQIPSMGKEQLEAEIISVCFDRDVALLKLKDEDYNKVVHTLGKINYLKIGDSDKLHRAEEVMYQGYPLGQQGIKSTVGVVSGRENMHGRQYIQIDAAGNPGCSGGPTLNFNGEVIGVLNSGITAAQNVTYIIPANELKVVLDDLYNAKNPLVRRPFLGIFYGPSSDNLSKFLNAPSGGGVYVTDVYQDSVLYHAGVKGGDIVYEINGYKIDYYGEISVPWAEDKISLTEYVSYLNIGQKINLVAYRDGEMKLFSFEFKQSKLPPVRFMYPDFEKIDYEIIGGFVVMELTRNHVNIMGSIVHDLLRFNKPKNQTKSRLLITHIFPASLAQRARIFEVGSIINSVNGEEVNTLADFRKALYKSIDTGTLTMRTMENLFGVLPFAKALQQEVQLSAIYHYPVSKTVQNLYGMMSKKIQSQAKKSLGIPSVIAGKTDDKLKTV